MSEIIFLAPSALPADAGKAAKDAYLREFIRISERRLRSLKQSLDIDFVASEPAFIKVIEFVRASVEAVPTGEPERFGSLHPEGREIGIEAGECRLTDDSIGLAYEVGIFLGECIRNETMGSYWTLGRPPKKSSCYNLPVVANLLSPMEFDPFPIGYGVVQAVLRGSGALELLMRVSPYWIDAFRGGDPAPNVPG